MKIYQPLRRAFILLFEIALASLSLGAEAPLNDLSISQLEEKLTSIQAELEQLATINLRTGAPGTAGYRSRQQEHPEIEGEWIQIDLEDEVPINEIVLVPTLWRYGNDQGYQSDGFPEVFRIIVGTENNSEGSVVAEFDSSDNLLPRIAPVVVPLDNTHASWVRIEPSILSSRDRDRKYIFQLSEVLIFSEGKNVALHQTVTCASNVPTNSGTWRPDKIVDGGLPYFMDSARGAERSAYFQTLAENPVLTIDLEQAYPISTIHIHAAYLSKSAPPEFNVNKGIPKIFSIEGANQASFSDSTLLLKHEFKDIGDLSPIMMWNISPTTCRYIRISGEPFNPQETEPSVFRASNQIGFAEIELISKGTNVALNKGPIKDFSPDLDYLGLAKMTDGHNIYGKILPINTWMTQLARRHDLERELTLSKVRLDTLYEKQQTTLLLFKRLLIALVLLFAATVPIGRHLRIREAHRIRERFTADLHDHLGASLHAIGILGSHTKDILDSPDKLVKTLDQINLMTTRASEATRDFCNQQMSKEAHENLLADLKRTTSRMISTLSYTFDIEGEEFLQQLKPRIRSDFFLFYKESLININRHADATEVNILIRANPQEIFLQVSDNGHGFNDNEQGVAPPSLTRRARFLKSKIKIDTVSGGGTRISLKIKNSRRTSPTLRKKNP